MDATELVVSNFGAQIRMFVFQKMVQTFMQCVLESGKLLVQILFLFLALMGFFFLAPAIQHSNPVDVQSFSGFCTLYQELKLNNTRHCYFCLLMLLGSESQKETHLIMQRTRIEFCSSKLFQLGERDVSISSEKEMLWKHFKRQPEHCRLSKELSNLLKWHCANASRQCNVSEDVSKF